MSTSRAVVQIARATVEKSYAWAGTCNGASKLARLVYPGLASVPSRAPNTALHAVVQESISRVSENFGCTMRAQIFFCLSMDTLSLYENHIYPWPVRKCTTHVTPRVLRRRLPQPFPPSSAAFCWLPSRKEMASFWFPVRRYFFSRKRRLYLHKILALTTENC
jgi:hypothetical protein